MDIAGKLLALYANNGLQTYDAPKNCYEFYVYLESLATLAKLYLKVGNYAGALQALRLSHLTDGRDTFDHGNFQLLTKVDGALEAGLRQCKQYLQNTRYSPRKTPEEIEWCRWRMRISNGWIGSLPRRIRF